MEAKYMQLIITIIISGSILILLYLDNVWFKKLLRRSTGYVLRNPQDEKKVKELDLAYCVREHHPIKIVTGDADIRIYNSNFYAAVEEVSESYKRRNGNVPVEIVCGPILIKDDNGKSYVLEAAKKGIIKLFRSNIRQEKHFRVGVGKQSCYVEQPHGVLVERKERNITIYFNNGIETHYYLNQFNKIISSKDIELIDAAKLENIYKEFIALTIDEFKTNKEYFHKKEKDISNMSYLELKTELML